MQLRSYKAKQNNRESAETKLRVNLEVNGIREDYKGSITALKA